jgi:hypothetical protein
MRAISINLNYHIARQALGKPNSVLRSKVMVPTPLHAFPTLAIGGSRPALPRSQRIAGVIN